MSEIRTLPRLLKPVQGVSLPSYVDQLAEMYSVPLQVMLKYLGLTSGEKYEKLNGFGIVLSDEKIHNVAKATGVEAGTVSKMLLSSYNGICLDLSDIDETADSVRRASVREWAYFSGSFACPQCLEETNGAWQVKWKLPWSFACVTHRCLLIDTCPQCERRLRSGRADGSLSPLFVKMVPHPILCGNPKQTGMSVAGKGAVPCGCVLSDIAVERPSAGSLKAQHHLNRALDCVLLYIAGQEVSTENYFSDLKGLYALLLRYSDMESLGSLSIAERTAIKDFKAAKDEKDVDRSSMLEPRSSRRTRYIIGAPKSSALMAALSSLAVEILDSPSVESAALLLRPITKVMTDQGKTKWNLIEEFHFSPILSDIFQTSIVTRSTFNRAIGARSVTAREKKHDFESKNIPQLISNLISIRIFRSFFPRPEKI